MGICSADLEEAIGGQLSEAICLARLGLYKC